MLPVHKKLNENIGILKDQVSESIRTDPIVKEEEIEFVSAFLKNSNITKEIVEVCRDTDILKYLIINILPDLHKLLKSPKDPLENTRFLVLYLTLFIMCINNARVPNTDELLDRGFIEMILNLHDKIIKQGTPEIVCDCYLELLEVCGDVSCSVYPIFHEKFNALFARKASTKEVKTCLSLFSKFVSTLNSLSRALQVFLDNYSSFKKYRKDYCDTISQMVIKSFKKTPSDFCKKDFTVPAAQSILDVYSCKRTMGSHKWESLICLSLLNQNHTYSTHKANEFSPIIKALNAGPEVNDQDFERALNAALYSAMAVVETNASPYYNSLFQLFKENLCEIAENKVQVITNNYTTARYFMSVYLPVALFITDQSEFDKILLLFTSENTKIPRALNCQVIERCSHFINSEQKRKTITKAIIYTLEASASDKEVEYNLHHIFNTFQLCPDILESILVTNPGLASLLWKPCSRQGMKALTWSFVKALESRVRTEKDWQIIECTASSILSSAHLYMALKDKKIMLVGLVLKFIMFVAKELISSKPKFVGQPQVLVFVMQMEGICLCMLPTPLSKTVISILKDVIQIAEEEKVVQISQLPVGHYRKLIDICNKDRKFNSSDPEVFKPLQEICLENTSVTKALCHHIATIAHAVDPIAVNETISTIQNEMSYDLLMSEFTDTVLLFGALAKKLMPSFSTVLEAVLQSSEFIGINMAMLLPKTLSPTTYAAIGKCIIERSKKISARLNNLDSYFTANAMKLLQLLISSSHWDTKYIYNKDLEELALAFTSYINMLASPQRLFQCSEFLVAVLTKYRTMMSMYGKMLIGRTITSWLGRIDCGPSTEKAGASCCLALALALDGITFSVESYDELQYITTSLDTRLAKQPIIHKEIGEALAAIYKSNLSLFSRYELARTLMGSDLSRAAYILAANEALNNNNPTNIERSEYGIIDALFDNDFQLIKDLSKTITVKQAEVIGYNIALAALSRHVEMDVISLMTDIEIMNSTEENKNMIFRGNMIMSRTVVAFARICGKEWVGDIYEEISSYVQSILEKGESLNIKQQRLKQGEDINKNRESYRRLFIKAINVITMAIPRLPIIIIHMLQIVYSKIASKFGQLHGTKILNGILFLRFIIPTLTGTSPKDSPYKESVRQSLINLSVGLMAAALRGDLTDKGPDFIPFNDIAELALDRFSASVNHIIGMDLKQAASRWIEVDERVVGEALAINLAPLFNELTAKLNEVSEGREMTKAENTLLSLVFLAVDQPRQRHLQNIEEVFYSSPPQLKEIINMQPTDEEDEKLDKIFFNDSPELCEFSVFYLIFDSSMEISPKLLISHILKQIAEIKGKFYIIADLSDISQKDITAFGFLKQLSLMLPPLIRDNLIKLIITRSSIDFINHYSNNRKSIFYLSKVVIAEGFGDIPTIAALSQKMPDENNEVLIREGTSLITIINDRETLIRLGRNSIFFSFDINGFNANDVLFYTKIKDVSQLTALQNKNLQFTITTNKDKTLTFTTTPASSLYHLIISSYERVNTKPVKYPSIFTDSSDAVSTKWLLFIIALTGVQETSCKYLSHTSYTLLESTIKTFSFPIKLPNSPEKAAVSARDIMSKAAKAFIQEAGPFIVEFEKVVSVIDNPLPAFNLLPPWGIPIASGAGGYPAQRFIIELSPPNGDCFQVVALNLWKDISNPKYIKQMLKVFFPIATDKMDFLLDTFIDRSVQAVSEIAISEILERRRNAILISLKLVKDNRFDLKNYGVELLHATLYACGSTATNEKLAELTEEVIKKLLPGKRFPSIIERMIKKDYQGTAQIIADLVKGTFLLKKKLISLFKEDLTTQFKEKAETFLAALNK